MLTEQQKQYQKEYRKNNKEKLKQYYENNRDKLIQQSIKSYHKHKEQRLEQTKIYREKKYGKISDVRLFQWFLRTLQFSYSKYNKDLNKEYREYFEKNIDKLRLKKIEFNLESIKSKRLSRNKRERERKKVDPVYKLHKLIKTSIYNALVNIGAIKNENTEKILGCSFSEFKDHLENQFEPWMNWNNHGLYNGTPNYGWDIDHIIRKSTAKTEQDVIRLNHYTNLQPLCSYINRDIKC